ncbi:MAG: tetratricopeptide repeat protein [Thiohalocapsa sp.]
MSRLNCGAQVGVRPAGALPVLLAAALFMALPAHAESNSDGQSAGQGLDASEYRPVYEPYPGTPIDTGSTSTASLGDVDAATDRPTAPELTADLIHAVLVGEIAVQREDHRIAFTHYLHAAQLSRDPMMAELAARAALSQGNPKSAVRATSLWVELAPDSPRARQIGAYALIDAGDRPGALSELTELIRLARDRGQGFLQAAQMLTRVPDPAERVRMMTELVASDVDDADAQFALAMLAAGASDVDAAREHAERAAELRTDWNGPRVFLVRLLVSEERLEEAIAALDDFVQAEPDDQELLLLRAQFHVDADEYEAALLLFDDMLARGPGQPDLLFTAAVVALEMESFEKAREYLTLLRKTGARASDSAYLLGQVEELAGNAALALDWYARVRGENATNARVRIAGIHADRGDVERAREILQQLRDQFPADVTTLYLIEGELLRERDLEQQAIDVYTAGLSAKPDNPDLLYARAMLAVGMDRVDILEQDLRRILIADPDHVDALNALGYSLADRTDRFDEAQSLIERALQLRPGEPAILDSMGWVLFRRGDAEGAEPFLRQALAGVFDAEIAAHLGEVLWGLGKRDEARAVWERALAEDPQHEYLLRTIGRHRITQTGT